VGGPKGEANPLRVPISVTVYFLSPCPIRDVQRVETELPTTLTGRDGVDCPEWSIRPHQYPQMASRAVLARCAYVC
jgi:hypothetical protein